MIAFLYSYLIVIGCTILFAAAWLLHPAAATGQRHSLTDRPRTLKAYGATEKN
jgi:hypothetical protein